MNCSGGQCFDNGGIYGASMVGPGNCMAIRVMFIEGPLKIARKF